MSQRTDPNHSRLTVETAGDSHAPRIIFRGEADNTNLADLETALAGVELDGAKQVELDVSDLAFVDLAALRQLALYARQLREAGRDIKTYGAQPMLERLVTLVGVHDDLGLA